MVEFFYCTVTKFFEKDQIVISGSWLWFLSKIFEAIAKREIYIGAELTTALKY